jgi:hypothetical protein
MSIAALSRFTGKLILGAAAVWLGPAARAEAEDAHRVWLRWLDGRFVVAALHELRAVVPPSDDLPATGAALSGFWIELRTAAGDVRYRRIVGDPVRLYVERQMSGAPGEPIVLDRDEMIPQSRLFTLLVPAAAPGDELVLFGSPLVAGFDEQPASEIGRLTLVAGGAP